MLENSIVAFYVALASVFSSMINGTLHFSLAHAKV